MGINLIKDPNNFLTNNIENGIPDYQSFIPYVELYVVRNGDVEYQIRQDGTAKLQRGNNELVSLLGFDSQTGLYTSRYTDDLVGEISRESNDEGFGITDIDIEIKSKFVPYVNIKFLDIKGSSLLNPEQGRTNGVAGLQNGSKYSVLFDYPPATYVLIVKGAFGKAVRYILHMLGTNVTYDSTNGNFIIDAKFVGKTFAPLSDIKMGWIKAAPFIFENTPDFTIDPNNGVSSFFEFSLLGKQLYDKLNEFSKASTETKELSTLNEDFGKISSLIDSIPNLSLPQSISVSVIENNSEIVPISGLSEENQLFIKIIDTDPTRATRTKVLEHYGRLYSSEYRRLVGNNVAKADDIQVLTYIDDDDKQTPTYYFVYTVYKQNLINAKNRIIERTKILNSELVSKTEDIVKSNLGFEPKIENVFEILLRDIDIFFNKLREAGDLSYGDGGFPRFTDLKFRPDGTKIETAIYPGELEQYRNRKEVKFVESFCEVYLQQKTIEGELEEIKKLNEDGTKKLIPVSPYDTERFGSKTTLQYSSKNTVDLFLTNLLKRYFIATQYTYKGFWELDESGRNVNFTKFLAESESVNVVNSYFDEKIIDVLIALLENSSIMSDTNFLSNINATILNDKNSYKELNSFLNNTNITNSYSIDSLNTIYSFKDNSNYKGLIEYTGFNPQEQVVTEVDENSPNKFLLDAVRGGFINGLFKTSQETPKVTSDNLLFFEDEKNTENKFNTDFVNISDTFLEATLTAIDAFNPVTYFIEIIGTTLGGDEPEAVRIIKGERKLSYDSFADYFYTVSNDLSKKQGSIKNVQELELFLFSRMYDFNSSTVDGKFLYSGIIQMPNIFLYYIGKLLSVDNTLYNLSVNDRNYFISKYDSFKNKLSDYLRELNDILNSQASSVDTLQSSEFFTDLFTQNYLVNFTSFTFLNKDESDQLSNVNGNNLTLFYNLLKTNSSSQYVENTIPYSDELIRIDAFIKTFKIKTLAGLRLKKQSISKKNQELKTKLKDNDVKSQLYYSFKLVYDRWIKGVEQVSAGSQFAYPFNNGTSLLNKFKFVDRTYRDIGQLMVVNFMDLIDYAANSDSEVFGGISSFLSKNKFEFFPLPNFISAEKLGQENNWNKAFSIVENTEITTEPSYVCMYVGGYSSQNDDIITLNRDNLIPQDFADSSANVFAFNVSIGQQNQTIFKDIQFSTSEHKETGESLAMMDTIFNNIGNSNTPTPKGQSLFEVYENRSYTTSVTIPYGNMLIQPTQYFEVLNVPLFNGVYIILEVKHKISSSNNRVETTFSGSRVRKYIVPIVDKAFVDVLGIFDDLQRVNDSTLSSNIKQTGEFGQNAVATQIRLKEGDEFVRKEGADTNIVVRQSSGSFTNDDRFLTFNKQTIDTSNITVKNQPKKG